MSGVKEIEKSRVHTGDRTGLFSLRIYSTYRVEQDLSLSCGVVGAMSVDNSQDQVKASVQAQRQCLVLQ